MKTTHDPFDDLLAAALHGDLSPAERAQFEQRLATDPAARAAYQETQAMHDLLEKTNRSAQPDDAFEQRMISGVRRKLKTETQPRETAWASVVVIWKGLKIFRSRFALSEIIIVLVIITVFIGVALGPITNGIKQAQHASPEALAMYQQKLKEAEQATDAAKGTPSEGQITSADTGSLVATLNSTQSKTSRPMSDDLKRVIQSTGLNYSDTAKKGVSLSGYVDSSKTYAFAGKPMDVPAAASAPMPDSANTNAQLQKSVDQSPVPAAPSNQTDGVEKPKPASEPAPADTRKLVRDASLELEVKSYQTAIDQIGTLTKDAGGYVDTSNSQRGGNGKLQGTIVVKVLPQNLDGFLLKLRDLGDLKNQSISTQDVTKDYYDTQARLENSRRMETQLQELLKRDNGKVSDLLQVERELGRVRGDIEQMQGSLKLYDFQVQYATVTMQVAEKDLNQAAAYLLREQDNFSLFANDVEATFQQARQKALDAKAQILTANLNHNSGSDVSAELIVMVAPDQIETFLAQVRGLGRVANFTRQTKRVAKDGGDSSQPADQTLTENDKVQVHLSIRSDDESRKQVALTVVTPNVDTALDQAKTTALAQTGTEILRSSLNKTPEGQSTAQLSVRVPGQSFHALLDAYRALGRTASFSLQRDDNSGPGANGDDAPVILALSLTDDDTPLQQTNLSIRTTAVDEQAQQIKKDATAAGVEIKASNFAHQPDGTESAQMTLRLPLSKYPAFIEKLKSLGKVESLTVNRQDRPDQTRPDDTVPVDIQLQIHNETDLVPDNTGLWATLRQTFGEGISALLSSIKLIGVLLAFAAPWLLLIALVAWIARRIYISKK